MVVGQGLETGTPTRAAEEQAWERRASLGLGRLGFMPAAEGIWRRRRSCRRQIEAIMPGVALPGLEDCFFLSLLHVYTIIKVDNYL